MILLLRASCFSVCFWLMGIGLAISAPPRPATSLSDTITPAPSYPTLPFHYDPLMCPYMVIQVRINGGLPMPFALDTGTSTFMVLFDQTAQQLKLPLEKDSRLPVLADDASQAVPTLPLRSVYIPLTRGQGVLIHQVRAIVSGAPVFYRDSEGNLKTIAGVIGTPLLSNLPRGLGFQFDFRSQQVSVCHVPTHLRLGPGSLVLPMRPSPIPRVTEKEKAEEGDIVHIAPTLPISWVAQVPLTLNNGKTLKLSLDTGSPDSGLSNLGAFPIAGKTAKIITGYWDNWGYTAGDAVLCTLHAAQFDIPNVPLTKMPSPLSNTLGLDVLSRYLVTLDFAQHHLILQPPTAPTVPPITGANDVEVQAQNGENAVHRVASDSPAAEAGIRLGDQLVRVNGVSVRGWAAESVQWLLNGLAQTTARLIILRDGHLRLLTYTRRSVFDAGHGYDPTAGATFNIGTSGFWVASVVSGSPADKWGLKAEDNIPDIGTQPTAHLTPLKVLDTLNQAETDLTVDRMGSASALYYSIVSASQDSSGFSMPGYTVNAHPLVLRSGDSGSTTVTLTSQNGFRKPISVDAISFNGLPGNASLDIQPAQTFVSKDGKAHFTLNFFAPDVMPGVYPITGYATGDGINHRIHLLLTILPSVHFRLLPPKRNDGHSPYLINTTPIILRAGDSGITVLVLKPINRYSNSVSLNIDGISSYSFGLSAGLNKSAVHFTQQKHAFDGLYVETTSYTKPGVYSIDIRISSSGISRLISVPLTILPAGVAQSS